MSKQKAKRIHLIYGLIVSVLVISLGVALAVSGIHIYRSDPTGSPYTPDNISAHFQRIAILVYVTLGAIVGGVIVHLLVPADPKRPTPIRDDWQLMQKAADRAGTLSEEAMCLIRRLHTLRITTMVLSVVIFVGLMAYPVVYLLLWASFSVENATQDILRASIHTLVPAVLGLGVLYLGTVLVSKNIQSQTRILKSFSGGGAPTPLPVKSHRNAINVIRGAIFLVAVALIVFGAFNGSAKDVLNKAVKICTECIGLG